MKQGRRCEHAGCRAWAVRGKTLCYAHLTRNLRMSEPDSSTGRFTKPPRTRATLEQRIDEVVSRYAADTGFERESLADEISALRLVLARLLAEEEEPARLATSIPRVVDAVVRAVRAQRVISGAMAEGFTEAVTQVLVELGLGGES